VSQTQPEVLRDRTFSQRSLTASRFVEEEWEHHRYATRDLDTLGTRSAPEPA
jgi:hypothetical protein